MAASRFERLIDLARTKESDQRRELLREVTDLFFETRDSRTMGEANLFGDVLQLVAAEMQEGVLEELAQRFAGAHDAPVGLMRDLANHAFPIAGPVLTNSPVLDDSVLLQIVNYQSQAHIQAVAKRQTVSETVSDAIVKFGDDHALDALIRNDGAQLSRPSMEAAIDRARRNAALHEGVIRREDLPLDLLNEMYFAVESRLRTEILTRNSSVDPKALDEALSKTRERMSKNAPPPSEEGRKAEAFIRHKKQTGDLNARLLVSLYREGKKLHFLHGFADIAHLDFDTAAEIVERQDLDALAMVCRAADIERPLFVTIAVLICGGDQAMSRAEEFGRLYNSVPVESAQRAMRFFKVRKAAGDKAAAA
ncbi:MAG: DUF2336 domain-containing protein [Hyphomonadaceae bacterium]